MLAEVDGLHPELEELTGLLSGQLRIGGVYPTGPYDLFAMLADFRAAHPGVAIHMVEDTQDDTLAALRADDLDCAFIAHDPDALGDEFAANLLWKDELVVALPPGHTLAAEDAVTFEQLASRGPDRLPRELRDPAAAGAQDGRARPRAAQRVHLHGDGGGPRRSRAAASASRSCPRSVAEQPARRSSCARSRPSA